MKAIHATLLMLVLIIGSSIQAQTNSKLDSLIKSEPHTNDSLHYNHLIDIAKELNNTDRKKALLYYHKARKIAEHLNDFDRMGHINKFIGVNHLYLSNNDSSKHHLEESSSYFRATGDSLRIIANNTNIALIYQRENKIEEAVALYHEVIADSESIEEWIEVIFAKINLASLLINQSDHKRALNYLNSIDGDYDKFVERLKIKIQSKATARLSQSELDDKVKTDPDYQFIKSNYPSININQGICYKELEDYKSAERFLQKAVSTSKGNPYVNAYAYNNLGDIYRDGEQWAKALSQYKSGLDAFNSINNTRGKIFSLNNIGRINRELNNYTLAKEKFYEALSLANEIGFKPEIKDAHGGLSKTYRAEEKFDSAYVHYVQYVSIKDSIDNETRINAIQNLEVKYETDKEREEVARLALENEYKTKAQRTQLILFIIGILGLAGLGLYLYTRYRLKKEREVADYERATNAAMAKFVPTEFVKTLGRDSIRDVALGDEIEKEVTVLFSDIRNFSSMSEQMTPIENFRFVKKYAERMSPIVHKNGGFINQYLGDGIMAIFQNDPDNALRACIEMQSATESFNKELSANGQDPIRVGMGIHTGSLVMGIIGDENRQDAAIISDTVNSAARMESLTKSYGNKIVLSKSSLDKLINSEEFQIRALGQAMVKGKKQPLDIYECFDGDSVKLQNQKHALLDQFSAAVQSYYQRDFQKALKGFESIYDTNPEDLVAYSFIKRIKNLRDEEVNKVTPDANLN